MSSGITLIPPSWGNHIDEMPPKNPWTIVERVVNLSFAPHIFHKNDVKVTQKRPNVLSAMADSLFFCGGQSSHGRVCVNPQFTQGGFFLKETTCKNPFTSSFRKHGITFLGEEKEICIRKLIAFPAPVTERSVPQKEAS